MALAMLGRRSCGSSGSLIAASMGGEGLISDKVLRPAMPMLPGLRPYVRKHESSRRFSTGRESADKAVDVLRDWWQRYVKGTDIAAGAKFAYYYRLFVWGFGICGAGKLNWDCAMQRRRTLMKTGSSMHPA